MPQTCFRLVKQILVASFATQVRARILSGRNIFCTLGEGQQRRGLMPLGLLLLFRVLLLPHFFQPRPQGLLLVQNDGRKNPWPRLLKYFKNRRVFCHVTHDEVAFSEVVSSVWRPCLFSAIENRCSNETKTFHRVYVTKF